MHLLGAAGFPRRLADPYHYESFRHLLPMNQFMTICAIGMVSIQIVFRVQLFLQHVFRQACWAQPLGLQHAGMDGA